jgi:conflict system STAND superfamily ATPase
LVKHEFPLAAPDLPALMEMITGPAAVAGLSFEEGLPGLILRDTGSEPGSLALMAFALAELYGVCQPNKTLTHAAYGNLGGVRGAIAKRADAAYNKLDDDARNTFGQVFMELVEVDSERGIPTRKRSSLTHLNHSPAARTFIEQFAKARLLVCDDPHQRGSRGRSRPRSAIDSLATPEKLD